MGFHIKFDSESEQLIKKLKVSPEDVFDDIYDCYLLFLIGSADQEAFSWLTKNMIPLDALTGKDLAFCLFLKSLPIKLHVDGDKNNKRPKNVGQIDLREVKSTFDVKRIFSDGRYGMVYDQDEVTAITYATDEIARQFNILNKLPCVIVLDPIPLEDANVVQLSPEICNKMIPILREALTKYIDHRYKKGDIKSYVKKIIQSEKDILAFEKKPQELNVRIEKTSQKLSFLQEIDKVINLVAIEDRLETARLHLESGSIRRFRNTVFNGVKKRSSPAFNPLIIDEQTYSSINALLEKQGGRLQICIRTIAALENYAEPTWERNEEWKQRIFSILCQYVEPNDLCDIPKNVDSITIESLYEIILHLKERKNAIVYEIFRLLPDKLSFFEMATADSKAQIRQAIVNAEYALKELEAELSDHDQHYATRKRELERKLTAAIEDYESVNLKLFSPFFVQEIKSYILDRFVGKTKNAFASFGAGLLNPDTLLKIFEFVSHSRA